MAVRYAIEGAKIGILFGPFERGLHVDVREGKGQADIPDVADVWESPQPRQGRD